MKKKTKEKPKGKICPILSKMFYADVAPSFADQGRAGGVFHNPKYEIRAVTWHCEKEKCQWWIPEVSIQTVTVVEGKKAEDTRFFPKTAEETARGWCGGMSTRGPTS